MDPHRRWSWQQTLALAGRDRWVTVRDILMASMARRCELLGIREGSVVRCIDREADFLVLEARNGETMRLHRTYAWFVGTLPEDEMDGLRMEGMATHIPELEPTLEAGPGSLHD